MKTVKTISLDYKKSPDVKERENSCRQARMDAISFIGISKKTSGKITGWLLKKGYPDSIIAVVISELTEEKTINDKDIADRVLASRNKQKAESSYSAYKRLLRLGIAKETAKSCIDEAYHDCNREFSDAIMLLRLKFMQKIDTMDKLDQEEQLRLKQKMFRFILNRGYNRELALLAMNSIIKNGIYEEE